MPDYKGVRLLREETVTPMRGPEKFKITADLIQHLADGYDPQWIEAPVNLGHTGRFEGRPAMGVIERLYVVNGELLGDVKDVPWWLAYEIDNGYWICSSVEIEPVPQKGAYVTGLALTGRDIPAVPGLGRWPKRTEEPAEELELKAEDEAEEVPAAAFASRAPHIHQSIQLSALRPEDTITISLIEEVHMGKDDKPTGTDDAQTQAPEGFVSKAEFTALQNKFVQQEAERKSERTANRLKELKASGKINGAQLKIAASLCAGLQTVGSLQFTNGEGGTTESSALDLFFDYANASAPQLGFAKIEEEKPGSVDGLALNAANREIAAQLGIPEEEFAAELAGKPVTTVTDDDGGDA